MKLLKKLKIYRLIKARAYALTVLLALGFAVPQPRLMAQIEEAPQSSALSSEAPTLRFEHLGVEQGMLQNSANYIMQDKNGYLWISTQGGLHRYDGYEFKAYTAVPFDTSSLSQSWVWSTSEASNGDIWVNTNDGGLNRLNPTTGKTVKYLHDPHDSSSISSNLTFYTLESSTGDLWVSTFDGGLNRMRPGQHNKFEHLRHDPADPNTVTSDELYWITEDDQQQIWVGSANGINKIDPATNMVKRFLYDEENSPTINDKRNVLSQYHPKDNSGYVWLATGRGLVRMDEQTGDYKAFLIADRGLDFDPLNLILKISPDPFDNNILWVGGPGTGLARFDMRTEKFTTYRNDPKDRYSLSDNIITSLFTDRSGTMWAGSGTKGLNVYNPKAVNFTHIKHKSDDPSSLAPGVLWVIFEDSQGTLWVGTDTGGENYLTQFDAKTRKVIKHKFDPADPESLRSGRIAHILEGENGSMWIGTSTGLCELDRKTGKAKDHIREDRDNTYIRYLEWNRNDPESFWVSNSEEGLDLFNTRTKTYTDIPLVTEKTNRESFAICTYQDNEGVLWVGTIDGLFKVDKNLQASFVIGYDPQDTTSLSDDNIYYILERQREPGILWIATAGGGLNRYDTETGITTHITTDDGLADNTIYAIEEDNNGTLWVSTNAGICNYNPDTNGIRNYGLEDGLLGLEYNARSNEKGADGTLYFGNSEGITAFTPERLSTNQTPPQVVLADVKLFNKSVASGPGSLLQLPSSTPQDLTLDFDQNELTFEFVAIHFTNPKKNRYSYQLVGFDDDWIVGGQSRSATYTNLEPGKYTFRVKAANSDGVWNEEGFSLKLTVLPPWYRTWWAYVLFALLFVLGVFLVDRLQRYRLRKIEKERAVLREAELRAEAENKRRADTEKLSKIGRAITSSLSVDKIIETVYENVNALMDASVFGVGIYNQKENRLDFPATKEEDVMLPPYAYAVDDSNESLAVWCFRNEKEIVISDFANQYGEYLSKFKHPIVGKAPASVIYIPLIQQGRTIGVITTQSFEQEAYTAYHVNLFRNLANYAAIALDNASAYRRLDATLTELQSTQEQLVHSEKMASLGELTAGIAHEIQNPLNFVNNFSEVNKELIEDLKEAIVKNDQEEVQAILHDLLENEDKVTHHGKRAEQIVKSMLQHSRGSGGEKEPTNLNALCDEYLRLAYHGFRAKDKSFNADFELDLEENLPQANVVPQDIGRVLLNLINNAFQAVQGVKNPKVVVSSKALDDKIELIVADNGPGIPDEIKEKIFQPFFTTKPTGQGTGLGLSMSYDIITKGHGGTISLTSEQGAGCNFKVIIPIGK
jgi:signal transduction histidine kinase/ligand-binding sensor domain-containing protein